jgi:hypothetical protein
MAFGTPLVPKPPTLQLDRSANALPEMLFVVELVDLDPFEVGA